MAGCSSQSLGGSLLFVGWHLVQTALSTTVIPLCGVNKTENCTTTVETVLPVTQTGKQTECKPEWQSFCFNGECKYSETLERYYCRCNEGFIGERCSHSNLDLVKQPLSNEYLAFTILMCLFFFIAILLSIYFYRRYLNKKQRLATSKNYKEVATDTEKDHKLLHV
ncbi:proepiregulin [Python bivittatus]|uniref:Proepiregulin n=1 Tax=Python bivittatus TaxID=176946 RepID=A0A9F2QUS8_PYTBI|nr:proepiregulin [Python bivittatus]